MSHRSNHTHCQSPTSQRLNQSFAKECACPTLKEKLKISSPSENKKYPNAQADTTKAMLVKHNSDNGLQTRRIRTPAGNSVYVAIAGEVVNRRSLLLRNFVLNGKVSASNPLLHIHANRYGQAKETLIVNDKQVKKF